MIDSLFQFELSPLLLIVRAVVVYFFIPLLLRLSGKRQLGQMSATELVARLQVL